MALDFYNAAEYIAYPFIDLDGADPSCQHFPYSAIVDCGFIMGPDAGYADPTDSVYLSQVSRSGSVFTFVFVTTASGAASSHLSFTRNVTDGEFLISEGASASPAAVANQCPPEPYWTGFLVTGDLTNLAALLPGNGVLNFTAECWQVEPARIQNLAGVGVSGISLANYDRRHVTSPAGCSSLALEPLGRLFVNAVCLTGDVTLVEGYSISLLQNAAENTITINAGVGLGAGVPCNEVPLTSSEAAPDGSPFLSGGPSCTEILKTINGVSGPVINLIGEQGILIFPHETKPNTIVIEANIATFAQGCLTPPCEDLGITLYNTGLDVNGQPMADCGNDANWTFGSGPAIVAAYLPAFWLANGLGEPSKWISPTCNTTTPPYAAGQYLLTMQFTMPPDVDPQYVLLTGRLLADGGVANIYVNSIATGWTAVGTIDWQQFELNQFFQSGTNTISFLVQNTVAGPTGLRVEWLSACLAAQPAIVTIPPPATITL